MGIRDQPTSPRSPLQNGYAERLIGSIRRECLDHVVVLGERHLRHVLLSYICVRIQAKALPKGGSGRQYRD
jgi:transposase InsO family protein